MHNARILGLVQLVGFGGILDFADVNYAICAVNQHVNLRTFFAIMIRCLCRPGIHIGLHSGNAKARLYLRHMPEAYALKCTSPPAVDARRSIVECPMPRIAPFLFLYEFEIEKAVWVNQLVQSAGLGLADGIIVAQESALHKLGQARRDVLS